MEENKKAMAQAILLLSEQKDTQAEPILKELAANGDVEAKFTLAGLYLSGGNGIVKNEAARRCRWSSSLDSPGTKT